MTLSARLVSYFSKKIRERGERIYRNHLVTITDGSEVEVVATVQGSSLYDVELTWEEGALNGWCGCPYFEDTASCKHLWATILAAEAKGHLSAATANEGLAFFDHDNDEPYAELSRTLKAFSDRRSLSPRITTPPVPKPPAWRQKLSEIANRHVAAARETDEWPAKRQIVYVVDVADSIRQGALHLDLMTRDKKKDGTWSWPAFINLKHNRLSRLPLAEDREILAALEGAKKSYHYVSSYDQVAAQRVLRDSVAGRFIPEIVRTGRCFLKTDTVAGRGEQSISDLAWDDNGAWRFSLKVAADDPGKWRVTGFLRRGEEFMPLSAPVLMVPGLVFTNSHVATLEEAPFAWVLSLRKEGLIEAPENERDELMTALLCLPDLPPLEVPEELHYEEIKLQPQPRLKIRSGTAAMLESSRLKAEVFFQYEEWVVSEQDQSAGRYEADSRRFVRRDFAAEKAATEMLRETGVKYARYSWSGLLQSRAGVGNSAQQDAPYHSNVG